MASRKSRKRRAKRYFPWPLVWCLASLVVSAFGLYSSSLTQVTDVKVYGAEQSDQQRIANALRKFEEMPALKISNYEVEYVIEQGNTRVSRAEYRDNIFGRASLKIWTRVPVAALEGATSGIAEDGVTFPLAKESPKIAFAKNVQDFPAILALCDPSPLRWALALAKNLQVIAPNLTARVALDNSGRLSLYSGELLVTFGDADRLPEKVAYLAKALKQKPELARGFTVNLVDLEHPTQSPTKH